MTHFSVSSAVHCLLTIEYAAYLENAPCLISTSIQKETDYLISPQFQ